MDKKIPDTAVFPIVGIGASAGGLEPLQHFFRTMPADSGLGFVVIQHLSPSHESLMANILSRDTTMPVRQIEDDMPVEPDHVYVIRPDRNLTIEGGLLKLSKPTERRGHRRPIDIFLRSLAQDRQEKAVAILLSGSGTNGTVGIKDIKEHGGLVLVQDPQEAEYDGMPRSAISAGHVDYILPVAEMPRMLLEFVRQPYIRDDAWRQVPKDFEQILNLLHTRQDCDFRSYKKATLVRRIQRRMNLHHIEQGTEYLSYLRAHAEELQALAEDLLISVTCFFRDADAWNCLEHKIIPQLLERQQGLTPLRIWVAGCASGEEVYSLGMVLLEQYQAIGRHPAFQIFASDLDQRALQTARAGLYPDSIEADVSTERLKRFFQKEDSHYRVSKMLRDTVVFAVHNVLNDPPFSALDLISCRNMMIFLENQAQKNVLGRFHFALKPEGMLFLGTSETVGNEHDLFEPVSKRWRIYRRTGQTRPDRLMFSAPHFARLSPLTNSSEALSPTHDRTGPIQQQVLARHSKACVVIDRQLRIHYLFGPTEHYLVQPRGGATFDLMAWLHDSLRGKLLTTLPQSLNNNHNNRLPMTITAMLRRGETLQEVLCTLEPLENGMQGQPLWLLVFEDRPELPILSDGQAGSEHGTVEQLEYELRLCRENLQATSEQLAHINEEYRSSHEEAISVNEELQSTNEELETSKEELQSFNEELHTLNQQLHQKNNDLERAYNDINNLLASTEVATLFLDAQLCIRRFTPHITRLMRLISSDQGRSIEDITTKFKDQSHLDDARRVLANLIPQEAEVQTEEGAWYLRRTLPYRTEDNRIDGVVITFVDITERKRIEEEMREAKNYAERIIDTLHEPLLVLDPHLRVKSANPAFYRHFQVRPEITVNRLVYELGNGQWNTPALRDLFNEIVHAGDVFDDFEVEHNFEDLGWRVMLLNARRLDNSSLILLGIRDITDRKRAEAALRDTAEQLRQQAEQLQEQDSNKNQFLGLLGHELRNPLAAMQSTVEWLRSGSGSEQERQAGLDLIYRQERHLLRLVDDLLNLTRISRGIIELQKTPLALHQVVEDAVELLHTEIEAKQQQLIVDQPKPDLYLNADPERLVQMLSNLLSNATRYTPEGGQITLRVAREGEQVVIRVQDTGVGIAAEELTQLFTPFTRLSRPSAEWPGGLGLGLALAHQLVVLHGGRLEAASAGVGKGSEFIVYLPALPATWQPGTLVASANPTPKPQPATLSTQRILLVEDDKDVAEALLLLLQSLGCGDVRACHRGEEALALAQELQPQVAFIDISLPDISGHDVARHLRKVFSANLKLVALTGYGRQQDIKLAEEAGFDRYLLKPADLEEIRAVLQE